MEYEEKRYENAVLMRSHWKALIINWLMAEDGYKGALR